MRFEKILAGLLLVLAIFAAASGRPAEAESWTRVDSDHFTVIASTPAATAAEATLALEQLREVLVRLAPEGALDSLFETRLYLFGEATSFAPYRLPGTPPTSGGYVLPGELGTYAALLTEARQNAREQVYRQYIQQQLNAFLPDLPAWLHYGIAELYSNFEADAQGARLGLPLESHIRNLRGLDQTATTVGGVLAGSDISTPSDEASTETLELGVSAFRMTSWGLAHYFLIGDQERREQAMRLVQAVSQGKDSARAIEDLYGLDLEGLATAFSDYVARESFPFLRLETGELASPELRSRALSAIESLTLLGDLLSRSDPDDPRKAEALYRQALLSAPDHGAAWAGLGRLAWRGERFGEAREAIAKALQAHPEDFTLHYLRGDSALRALGRRRPQSAEERALLDESLQALGQSTRLEPRFAPAWERLGFAHSLAPKPSPEAVPILERAVEMLPQRADLRFNLLLAQARVGDREAVAESAARLRGLGADAATLRRALEIELQLDLREGVRLVHADRLADAIALFSQVQALTNNATLRADAQARLEVVEQAEQHNRFSRLYERAVQALRDGDEAALSQALTALEASARPGLQRDALAALRDGELR